VRTRRHTHADRSHRRRRGGLLVGAPFRPRRTVRAPPPAARPGAARRHPFRGSVAACFHNDRSAPRRRSRPPARTGRRLHRRVGGLGAPDDRLGRRPVRAPLRRRPDARAPSAHRPATCGPRAARAAAPRGRVGHRHGAPRPRRAARRRPRSHAGTRQRRRALDARARNRSPDLFQLHALAATGGRGSRVFSSQLSRHE
jgi:hypothetical protein